MRTLHVGLRVTDLARSLEALAGRGIEPVAPGHDGDDGLKTAFIADPDGRRIELVQWPAGHTDGMTSADWPEEGN